MKINICCTPSFHLSLEMMKKTMIFMNNSGDVDDAEADYTCPSWIRAFDVRCIFVGGVVRSGQEKQREGVIPNTSQAHCSNTATYLPPTRPASLLQNTRTHTHLQERDDVACVMYAIKYLCIFITTSVFPGCVGGLFTSLWSQSAPVAWHHICPVCL